MASSKRKGSRIPEGVKGEFKRITISRVETVIRKGTADIWVPLGVSVSRNDGGDDTEVLADLLEDRNAIQWEDEAHMEDYMIEMGLEQEPLPAGDQHRAVPCVRDEDGNWDLFVAGGR